MATGKRGRPAKNDLEGKTFLLDGEDFAINVVKGSVLRDMYGNAVLWEGDATYFNPWSGLDEKLPKGKRSPIFSVLFDVDGDSKELRFNCERKIEAAERRAKMVKA